ncbi:putative mitochondrial outer membrane protein iml2 protein [Botrytis fragariae]|uniref:Inclusion body clearance protein IML2 n=1 Tax=Botrytis fragariae TaxID=1964551 RepID=A0A8H6ALP7_9HELO|nr:putative mitochondrial outer membrane protein iml2 protein [Botrytis fragariae]KAF5869891.1 putative mitochondrial outer membrane protein iml2 protein [Botrytis fragariae]
MSRWFRSAVKAAPTMVGEDEEQHLRDVEAAMLKLLNDDIDEADKLLKKNDSSYHHLGRGISGFLSAMMGVEKDLLKEAAVILLEAENKSWEDMKKAQKESTAFQSNIYPQGTEYLLCYSVAQLTSAITAVLSGSITEAVKGFYKLRKAYLTLDGILEIENKYLEKMASSNSSTTSLTSRPPSRKSTVPAVTVDDIAHQTANLSVGDLDEKMDENNASFPDVSRPPSPPSVTNPYDIDPALAEKVFTNRTDIFIHSGVRLCCGLLLLVFSMIENPIFNKILYIVGFKGDRERGTRLLWQATRYQNFNSAIAALALLGYYNGLVGFCDILPTDAGADENLTGYPQKKCQALLAEMKARHPDSRLWKLEEARMLSYNQDLKGALEILEENSKSKMKQIAMINTFEMALTTLFFHEYQKSATAWINCSEQSAWSPTLYHYMAGASYVELYRNTRVSDPTAAKIHKKKATEFLMKAPPLAGKQKVMAKQLPFDIYIVSKVGKWEQRAKTWNVDLIDAIGPSPFVEMIYFWNGVKKSGNVELQKCLDLLEETRMTCAEKCNEDEDDGAIHLLLRGCVMRNMGRYEEARKILTGGIVDSERHARGALRDDWTLPSAYYELACCSWHEKDLSPAGDTVSEGKVSDGKLIEYRKEKVLDCEEKLLKLHSWPQTYVFEARMSFKISTSLLTVRRERGLSGL